MRQSLLKVFRWLISKPSHKSGSVATKSSGSTFGQDTDNSGKVAASIDRLVNRIEASGREQDSYNRRKFRWDKWTAIGIWLYTGLTAAIVLLSLKSNFYASESASQARRQADIAESGLRPYVLEQINENGIQIVTGVDTKPHFSVDVSFVNYGATPAIITHLQGEINIKLPSDSYPDPKDYYTGSLVLMTNKDGAISPLRKTWDRPIFNNEVTLNNLEMIAPYVHGRIEYSDVAGHTFHRFFCYHKIRNANRAWYLQPINQSDCPTEVK